MNERLLLEMASTLGYRLAMSGAETYRVEESIIRVLQTYGYEGEAFAIPNCLIVSINSGDGRPMTRMRRIGPHGNDLDAVERYSNLSRAICGRKPSPEDAMQWLDAVEKSRLYYNFPMRVLGYFLGGFGFCFTFGGGWADAFGAGICGLLIMAVDLLMDKLQSTQFFRTIIAAFCSALPAYFMHHLGLIANADATIIGALMLLVPGLLFTNAMRDVMYGDTNSGLNRVVLVLLIAVAIALGTAAALQTATYFWGDTVGSGLISWGPVALNLACFVGTTGFCIYFNIHGIGWLLCGVGGIFSYTAYMIAVSLWGNIFLANLIGGLVASVYAEIMARIRHFPAISYLVVAIFPLIPGAGVYYTMAHAVRGDMAAFASKGFETAAVAGSIALGILLVSTAFRIYSNLRMQKRSS